MLLNWREGANGSDVAAASTHEDGWRWFLLVLHAIICFVGSISNLLLLYSTLKSTGSQSSRSPVMTSLCAADALVSIIAVPVAARIYLCSIMGKNAHPEVICWNLGNAGCRVTMFLENASVAASTFSFMGLSLDRFHSFKRTRVMLTTRRVFSLTAVIVTIWVLANVVCFPWLLLEYVQTEGDGIVDCEPKRAVTHISYIVCCSIIVYLLPCSVVTVCHLRMGHAMGVSNTPQTSARYNFSGRGKRLIIFGTAAGKQKSLQQVVECAGGEQWERADPPFLMRQESAFIDTIRLPAKKSPDKPLKASKSVGGIIRANRRLRQTACNGAPVRQSVKARRRAARMLLALVVTFVLCWLPYAILSAVDVLLSSWLIQRCLPILRLVGFSHSALNPILHWFLNQQGPGLLTRPLVRSGKFRLPQWLIRRTALSMRARPNSSTTEEAALGPFNPKFVVPNYNPNRLPVPKPELTFFS